jgi:signal recognition particle subunit SRP54
MLESLKDGLRKAIDKIIGRTDREGIEEMIRDIQRTLISSDVDVYLVLQLSEKIRKRALEEKPKPGLTFKEHVINVVYEELVNIMGKESPKGFSLGNIILIGLFGSGKTTTCVKIANFYRKLGYKVAVVSCDTFRPAAMDQLEQLAKNVNIPYFAPRDIKDSAEIAQMSLERFKGYDVIIFDTSGRNALDQELANELTNVINVVKPTEVLLVIPADLGQAAGIQAKEFNKLVKITGIVITKLDSTAKGGGALTSSNITEAKVKFITTGEKIDEIELYDPKKFVARLLGFPDLESLLEKVKEVAKPELAKKIIEEDFDLNDFCEQIEVMQKAGPLDKIMEMMGLKASIPKEELMIQEEKMKKWKVIVSSMTPEERKNPEIINYSRIKRIAKGSGTREEDVKELLASYKKIKKMINIIKPGRGGFNILKKIGFK